ncbi:MAG: DUF2892 domain-containing protein [Bacillus sp. (in: firmicutes)]
MLSKHKPNISTINALLRITCGLAMLSSLTAKMVRRPWKNSYIIWAFIASMKVAEGIVRYCPMTALFNQGQGMVQNMLDDMDNMDVSLFKDEDLNASSSNQA